MSAFWSDRANFWNSNHREGVLASGGFGAPHVTIAMSGLGRLRGNRVSGFFERLLGPSREEIVQREYDKWNGHVKELERFLDSLDGLSVADVASQAWTLRAFWDEAEKELEQWQDRGMAGVPQAHALERVLGKVKNSQLRRLAVVQGAINKTFRIVQDMNPDAEVSWEDVRTVAALQGDPINDYSLENFRILESIAAEMEIHDDDHERHAFLLRYSRDFKSMYVNPDFTQRMAQTKLDRLGPHPNADAARRELRRLSEESSQSISASSGKSSNEPRPEPRLIRNPRDAELTAEAWMRYFGFDDAGVTRVGADEGIDVDSSRAVAQVKAHMVPVGRPDVQNLAGVAAAEKKMGIFFALNGYTPQAIAWADRADIALFAFDLQGEPEAMNVHARRLME